MKDLASLALEVKGDRLRILDQERLPGETRWIEIDSPAAMAEAIIRLQIRGAPLIGVGAALALGLHAERGAGRKEWEAAAERLNQARPTAVNLRHAVERMVAADDPVRASEALFAEDVALCDRMAAHGAALVADGEGILTHCNTGGLATAGVGTALGAIRRAHESGKRIHVFVDETRPLLQGARLTAWELRALGIPHTLLCDNAAAFLMASGKVKRVFVGADRIARNGDFANKIGTYSVALAAKHHGIAFHVVAPVTTVDLKCPSGEEIPIEERAAREVRGASGAFGTVEWSPGDCPVYNPAFDVTPGELVQSFVLDSGVTKPVEIASLA